MENGARSQPGAHGDDRLFQLLTRAGKLEMGLRKGWGRDFKVWKWLLRAVPIGEPNHPPAA